MSNLFIFGHGFCGKAIAQRQRQAGWQVTATVRPGHERAPLLAFDRDHPLSKQALEGVTHMISTAPPDDRGDPVLDWLLAHGSWPQLGWVGYLSTTGVYGDHNGDWVAEDAVLKAVNGRSAKRIVTERQWLASGLPVHIFRLAGIYGPGRSALETIKSGQAHRVVKPGQVFGRIHVDDVALVVEASMAHPNPGAIYNVSDDEPAAPWDVVTYGCSLLGVEPPPFIPWEQAGQILSPMAQTFYQDSKKVDNSRIKQELGVSLLYPNYRAGLDALLQEMIP